MRHAVFLTAVLTLGSAGANAQAFTPGGPAAYCEAEIIHGENPRAASSLQKGDRRLIVIDRKRMADLPYLDRFVIAHECGHHALAHTSVAGTLLMGHDFAAKELAADCWAARRLAEAGEGVVATAQARVFRALGNGRSDPSYPSYAARADKIIACLNEG